MTEERSTPQTSRLGETRAPRDFSARLRAARRRPLARWGAIVRLGVRMMVHDRAKFLGTVVGVVFAVVLAGQQIGILLGLLQKNTMFVDHAGADIWVVPQGMRQLQPGEPLGPRVLDRVRAADGVAQAAPVLYAAGTVAKPGGGTEAVTIVGVELPRPLGGPWNVVAGDPRALAQPDAMFFEDSRREKLGRMDLGSVREVNGVGVRAVGFTWGLLPFGPAYAFAEIDLARSLAGATPTDTSFVLVRAAEGVSASELGPRLAALVPEADVHTTSELHRTIVQTLLAEQLGISFGTSTAFGLLIGFVIVALAMFTSVLDHLREFGTLKAVGATSADLTRLLLVQSIGYALVGSFVGLGLIALVADGIRSANLSMIVPWQLVGLTPIVMTLLCVLAAGLALRRVRRLEPGMVFR